MRVEAKLCIVGTMAIVSNKYAFIAGRKLTIVSGEG